MAAAKDGREFMAEKILIVDDEKAILELASIILRNRGYEVLVADNARDGLSLVEREAPALVLLDYMMPAAAPAI